MPTVHQHAAARRDLVEQFVYLAEQAGLVEPVLDLEN